MAAAEIRRHRVDVNNDCERDSDEPHTETDEPPRKKLKEKKSKEPLKWKVG